MSVRCGQCGGAGGYLVNGIEQVSGLMANQTENPIPSGTTTVLCRQCNGTGVTLACGNG